MAYSEFTTIAKAREAFNLTVEEKIHLFTEIEPIAPSDYLKITLNENLPLANAINTEKARSELIITPVLLEVRRILNFQIGFFLGLTLMWSRKWCGQNQLVGDRTLKGPATRT